MGVTCAACSRNDLCHALSTTGAPRVRPTAHAAYDKGMATSSATGLLGADPIPTEGVRLSDLHHTQARWRGTTTFNRERQPSSCSCKTAKGNLGSRSCSAATLPSSQA